MLSIPDRTLTHGTTGEPITIPQLGYGVFQVPDAQTEEVTATALEIGYRHIDTAAIYGNEAGVGRAIAGSDIPRSELFVTTKLWNDDQGHDRTLAAFDTSLDKLGLDYVDLYLIHWPAPAKGLFVETWAAFEEILASGRARAIGVSNFLPEHLELLAEHSSITPAVNQIELHPRLQQHASREYARSRGIEIEALEPIGTGNHPRRPGHRENCCSTRQEPGTDQFCAGISNRVTPFCRSRSRLPACATTPQSSTSHSMPTSQRPSQR